MVGDQEYCVWRSTQQIYRFYVSDGENRPIVAEFPVSELYSEAIQKQRAVKFAEYMNTLREAAKTAHDQTHLVDILSRP